MIFFKANVSIKTVTLVKIERSLNKSSLRILVCKILFVHSDAKQNSPQIFKIKFGFLLQTKIY